MHEGRHRSLGRWVLPVSGGAAAFVAVLMLAAPMAGASSTITFSSPYTNLAKDVGYGASAVGCHTIAALPVSPGVSQSMGAVWAEAHAVAGSCGNGNTYADGYFDLGFQGFKFKAPSSGMATVTVNWAINWSARTTISGASTSSTPFLWSGVLLAVDYYLVDVSNSNSSIYTSNSTTYFEIADNGISSAGTWFANSHGATYSLTGDWVMTAGDTIEVSTLVEGYAYDYSDGTGGTAWSEINLGTPGLGGSVTSVTIS